MIIVRQKKLHSHIKKSLLEAFNKYGVCVGISDSGLNWCTQRAIKTKNLGVLASLTCSDIKYDYRELFSSAKTVKDKQEVIDQWLNDPFTVRTLTRLRGCSITHPSFHLNKFQKLINSLVSKFSFT